MKVARECVVYAALYIAVVAASVAVVATSVALVLYVGRHADHSRVQRAAAWDAWEADMRRAGCKVTGFTSERHTTYPIWQCPDGNAHLGRAQ